MTFPVQDLLLLLPEISIAVLTIVLLLIGVLSKRNLTHGISLVSIFILIFGITLVVKDGGHHGVALFDMFRSDRFTDYAKVMLLAGTILVMILSYEWLEQSDFQHFEFPLLMLFATLGMMLMISANDMMSMYMGLELASLSQYVLASFHRDSLKSTEAGLKYFVLGALASGMLLFGISLVYGFGGTTSFAGLHALLANADQTGISPGLVVGMVLIIVAFCFKISAVPFHMWTPDVYEGAPTPITAFFAIAPKIAAITLFTRVLTQPFDMLADQWKTIIIAISIASMVVGAFGALMQTNIKRLLAYSSIGHVGYMLIGIETGTVAGIQGVLIYLALYLVMSAGAFGCVLVMRRRGNYIEEMGELAGLSKTQPGIAMAMSIFMLSMAGIPPLAGFFGKFYIFLAAVQQGMMVLAVIGVLTSVVACFYYLKIIKLMYFDEVREEFDRNIAMSTRYALAFTALFTVFFFVYPTPLVEIARSAAEALQ